MQLLFVPTWSSRVLSVFLPKSEPTRKITTFFIIQQEIAEVA